MHCNKIGENVFFNGRAFGPYLRYQVTEFMTKGFSVFSVEWTQSGHLRQRPLEHVDEGV